MTFIETFVFAPMFALGAFVTIGWCASEIARQRKRRFAEQRFGMEGRPPLPQRVRAGVLPPVVAKAARKEAEELVETA